MNFQEITENRVHVPPTDSALSLLPSAKEPLTCINLSYSPRGCYLVQLDPLIHIFKPCVLPNKLLSLFNYLLSKNNHDMVDIPKPRPPRKLRLAEIPLEFVLLDEGNDVTHRSGHSRYMNSCVSSDH